MAYHSSNILAGNQPYMLTQPHSSMTHNQNSMIPLMSLNLTHQSTPTNQPFQNKIVENKNTLFENEYEKFLQITGQANQSSY